MNPFALSGLLALISCSIFGIFSWVKGKKFFNKIFAILNLAIAIWGLGAFKFSTALNQDAVFFWLRLGHIGVTLIPVFFTHFIFEFLEIKNKKFLFTIYITGLIFFALNITDWLGVTRVFIVSLRFVFNSFYVDSPPGFIYFLFVAFFFGSALYAHYIGLKYLKTSAGVRRAQIKYFLFASAFAFGGGGTAFPMVFGIDLYPYLHFTVFLYPIIMTYAIYKYRLMDLDLAWRYALAYLGYTLLSSLVFLPAILLLKLSCQVAFLLILLGFFIAPYFHKRLMGRFQKAALGKKYDYWGEFDKLKDTDLGYFPIQIACNLVEIVVKIMQLETASFFMWVKSRKEFRPQAQLGLDDEIGEEPICWVTLKPDNPLIAYLTNFKKPLIKYELVEEALQAGPVIQQMERLHAEVSIPLFVRGELIGILNLGPKETEEMYHEEDMGKLAAFCIQIENTLSHAIFMEGRATFSRELAHDMKNLFAKAIWPTVEFILEAKDPQTKDKEFKDLTRQLAYTDQRLKDNFDLISILERILKRNYTFVAEHLKRIVLACVSFYKTAYDKKGLSITLDLPNNLPKASINQEDIPKLFNNLLDNALKVTGKGGVTIKAEQKGPDFILITFSDTGRGMEKDKVAHIFEPKLKMPDTEESGTGLGLVIVKDIIEAHKGSIWAESEPNKGTTFYFTLPIASPSKGKEKGNQ